MTMKVGFIYSLLYQCGISAGGDSLVQAAEKFGSGCGLSSQQTCCGQPMANAGFENKAVDLARHFDEQFKNYDYIVGPSASCVVFVRDNYSRLLKEDKHRCQRR